VVVTVAGLAEPVHPAKRSALDSQVVDARRGVPRGAQHGNVSSREIPAAVSGTSAVKRARSVRLGRRGPVAMTMRLLGRVVLTTIVAAFSPRGNALIGVTTPLEGVDTSTPGRIAFKENRMATGMFLPKVLR